MKRRTERIARHGTALAIVVACVLAFAGVALSQVVSGTNGRGHGSTSTSSTGGSTTAGGNAKKAQICHFTKSKKHPAHTIWVSKAAEPSFLARGDHAGKCTDQELHPTTTTTATTEHSKPNHRKGGKGD
jgi:hypothetical protein